MHCVFILNNLKQKKLAMYNIFTSPIFLKQILLIYIVFCLPTIAMHISSFSYNLILGYKTELSMKNKENWCYANKLFFRLFLIFHTLFFVFFIIFFYYYFSKFNAIFMSFFYYGLIVLSFIITSAMVEYKLNLFDKKNKANNE